MTTNLELDKIVKSMEFKNKYLGTYMKDELKNLSSNDNCWLICNTDNLESKGSHWQLIWKSGNTKVFFSSFGSYMSKEIKAYFGSNILCSDHRIQEWGAADCGELCILVAWLLDNGIEFEDIILELYKTK